MAIANGNQSLAHHLNPRTIDRQIARWVEDGHLIKLAQGKYRKADA